MDARMHAMFSQNLYALILWHTFRLGHSTNIGLIVVQSKCFRILLNTIIEHLHSSAYVINCVIDDVFLLWVQTYTPSCLIIFAYTIFSHSHKIVDWIFINSDYWRGVGDKIVQSTQLKGVFFTAAFFYVLSNWKKC